jgi:two-component system phosphate regulon sensor histidine kinase PhoR
MQLSFNQIKWMPVLMTLTILAIAAFQVYWLKKAYDRENRTLEIRTNVAFRETVHGLQAAKLKLDRTNGDSVFRFENKRAGQIRVRMTPDQKAINMINVIRDKAMKNEGSKRGGIFIESISSKDSSINTSPRMMRRDKIMQFLYDMDLVQDSIRLAEINSAYKERLDQQRIFIPFTVTRYTGQRDEEEKKFNEVTIGFRNPLTYQLQLGSTTAYLMKRILAPILLSFFLIAFTTVSFALLYRNLIHQRRLADIKNEFISNITHELKTPIATVSVAIEALRSFNTAMPPERTKEYLDISASELQRLSLLVDKVLKLSMFEKKEIDLKYEIMDMQELVGEVTSSLRLQFEKHRAAVNVTAHGETQLEGDRLHLVSVIYNLLDNALKYSPGVPRIDISITGKENTLELEVKDSGIGVPVEYREKIFEKFFRVPTGNVHNAKGYGLGLSYVAHVINKHKGTIQVLSEEGMGSTFIVSLPKHKA